MSGAELLDLADRLSSLGESFERSHGAKIKQVLDAAQEIAKAWSGSNIGYHADVYYEDLRPRPPGAQFSSEWGLGDHWPIEATRGDWVEFDRETVRREIYRRAGDPHLEDTREESSKAAQDFRALRAEALSIFSINSSGDPFLSDLNSKAVACKLSDAADLARSMVPSGQFMTRDTLALTQGRRVASHQNVIVEMWSLHQPALCAKELAEITRQAGSHLARMERQNRRSELVGTNVFIGHGRSGDWRELKDFVKDRLALPYDEFNRVPVAGITNIARLAEMLDAAVIALLILTAEDELADGKQQARMNVIHEVGLFQGRLGFTRAIVLLEEGCEEFTNIQGLGQIRFPKGKIAAAFEEVRLVLEREEIILP